MKLCTIPLPVIALVYEWEDIFVLSQIQIKSKAFFNIYRAQKAYQVMTVSTVRIKDFLNLNPLQPGVAFLYPLKTSENL